MSIEAETLPAFAMLSSKRLYPEDEDTAQPSTPNTEQSSPSSSTLSTLADIATPKDMPMASTNRTSRSNSPTKALSQSSATTATLPSSLQKSSSAPPTKRRKLTPAEKLQRETEKVKKEQERAEAKARKEADTKAKEEEKERRERSQMRLSSFFALPKVSSPAPLSQGKTLKAGASPMKHGFIMKDEAHRRSMSLDPVDFEPATPTKSRLRSDTDKQAKQIDKGFLPFVLGKHMRLAPHNVFLPDTEDLMRVNEDMDSYAKHPPSPTPSVMESFATLKRRRGFQPPKVEHVIHKLQGSSNRPIDLTQNHENRPRDALNTIPIKYFSYGEDVRPPYRGTWTRMVDDRTARKLALQPVAQQLPEVDYNYDSEAEWEDVEEGEDLEAEDIEEEEEQDEEVDGFIDDDNAPQYLARRGIPASDVESKCSGLQWEDASGKMRAADARYGNANFSEFTVCFLLDPSPKTIDPFTTAYWDPEPKQVSSTLPLTSSMGPPRLPLQDRTNGQATMQITLVNGKVPKAAKVGPRLVPADLMPAFKAAVSGSDMTKIALIEALKKQFPKLRKDEITETISRIAQRVGAKQTEKRWVLLEDTKL